MTMSGDSQPGRALDKATRRAEKIARRQQEKLDAFRDQTIWQHKDALSRKIYADYDAYVAHQAAKLPQIQDRIETRATARTEEFRERFRSLDLPRPASVLCLGARLGYEVQAFIELGHFAVGIDLNPGEKNRYVVTGDFHNLVQADQSVDCVYTNCCDHIFDVAALAREVRRVLKPRGVFVADIVAGYEEGETVGEFDAMHWPKASGFAALLCAEGPFKLRTFEELPVRTPNRWFRAVMRVRQPGETARAG
ncbi:MAG: methyltransferase domain-containing protein [Alphaproteobacteria bacterium]|nr:methyltransferase domain-containing protein [Alphaproteobacteria bacterium]